MTASAPGNTSRRWRRRASLACSTNCKRRRPSRSAWPSKSLAFKMKSNASPAPCSTNPIRRPSPPLPPANKPRDGLTCTRLASLERAAHQGGGLAKAAYFVRGSSLISGPAQHTIGTHAAVSLRGLLCRGPGSHAFVLACRGLGHVVRARCRLRAHAGYRGADAARRHVPATLGQGESAHARRHG